MMEGLEARAEAVARRRVAAVLATVAAADLPASLTAERDGDSVVISGRGLVRALAYDARLGAIGLIA